MTLLVEDTARNNLATWTIEAAQAGHVAGAVMSPFSTPRVGNNYKQSAQQTVTRLQDEGLEVWLDPETHVLQMPSAGDFRYYDGWPLWSGQRGLLANRGDMRDHVERVFAEQDRLGVPHLAPALLLHSPQSPTSQLCLEMAQVANEIDPEARLAVVGDSAFWSAASNLDHHIGALAQLGPPSWSLTIGRAYSVLAAPVASEEAHGLCRTARALSEDAVVHVSHGDLAALPAVAAGATSIGTGWDPRQRVAAYSSYEVRSPGSDGGQWFQQSTLEGLLSLLVRSEATTLEVNDPTLAARLLPGNVPPGPKEAFLHHVAVLSSLVSTLGAADARSAFDDLTSRYASAASDWQAVARVLGITSRANAWIAGAQSGLALYGRTEGFN